MSMRRHLPPAVRARYGHRHVLAALHADSGEWLVVTPAVLGVFTLGDTPSLAAAGDNAAVPAAALSVAPAAAPTIPNAEPAARKAEPAASGTAGAGEELQEFAWWQFANGRFDGEARTLTLTFVDSTAAPLVYALNGSQAVKFVVAVTERIDDSILYQQFVDLPSGVMARGQVRRRWRNSGAEELFAQVPWELAASPADQEALAGLERALLEAVGR